MLPIDLKNKPFLIYTKSAYIKKSIEELGGELISIDKQLFIVFKQESNFQQKK